MRAFEWLNEQEPSRGPGIVGQLEAAGMTLRADGGDIVVRPLSLLTPELRALVAKYRDAVLAHLRARNLQSIMAMTLHACSSCARLEGGVRCTHYTKVGGGVLPEPSRPCRCSWFAPITPW